MPAASAWSPRSTASRAARWSRPAIDALKARVAPRRRRCRRQDRRRRRHPCRAPAGLLRRRMSSAHGPQRRRQAARRRPGLPAAHRPRRAGALPLPSSRPRSCASASTSIGWRQVPVDIAVIGEKANATRPEIEQIMVANAHGRRRRPVRARPLLIRRRIEKRVLGREHHRLLHLLAVVPLDHLQGHVPRRAARRLLSGPAGRALRLGRRDLPPALLDQHLPDLAAGAALPHARPQRRDQHAAGQHQLDEEPRDRAWRTHAVRRARARTSSR